MAIIGANGAGKSTLLSLVAGLAKPDEGSVSIDGRVAALLELGSGFHPDLTGSENVQLNAALLGLSRKRAGYLFRPDCGIFRYRRIYPAAAANLFEAA